jgi:hypothetical protein
MEEFGCRDLKWREDVRCVVQCGDRSDGCSNGNQMH